MRLKCAFVLASVFAGASSASASFLQLTASSGNLEATARFEVDPMDSSKLIITLTNSSTNDVLVPADVLTGVYWDITGPAFSLMTVSAVLNAGSVVHFDSPPAGGVVGGEFAYAEGLVGGPGNADNGISSSGLGLFGNANFPGPNLDPPLAVDGLQYGIVSAGDNLATGNTPVTGSTPLIQSSVIFTLMGLPSGFNPAVSINNIQFQYGTSLSEPHFPTPGAAGLMGIAGLFIGRRRR